MKKDEFKVLPFSVKVVDIKEGFAEVILPQNITIDYEGKLVQKTISSGEQQILVDPGRNMKHNIRRDVRKILRKNGIVVSFKEQEEKISIVSIVGCLFIISYCLC